MAHFYLDESMTDAVPGSVITVAGAEARHAVTVSRLAVGEALRVGNGAGLVVDGVVSAASPAEFSLEVATITREGRPSPSIALAQALAKGDRDELAVQAATELGVDAIVPWQAQRSISRWDAAKTRKGVERWSAIVREATKQSVRPWLPDVTQPVTSKQLADLATQFRILVLEPTAAVALTSLVVDDRDLLLVVGPEGGVAPSELELFAASGAEQVRLGDTVLRTSTAGPAAIAALNVLLGRW
jgi:16S rRNA (uracil1498-N3)-methyltransferase